jgi:hypothetical protein
MKKAHVIGLMLLVPFFLSAQQKGNSQQDMQKQIQSLKQEMQSQISALRDSIAVLQKQLLEQQQNKSGYGFFYDKPLQDTDQGDLRKLDSLLREHSYSGNWNFTFPEVPKFDYRLMVPPYSNGYQFDWKQLETPSCPETPKQKHKHDWMKMLPFYNLFKS